MDNTIVEILDSRVMAMPVSESEEGMIDVDSVGFVQYGQAPESPETGPYYRFLREGLISKLEKAQSNLPKGLSLRLYEGYRNPEFQKKLFHEQLDRASLANPQWNYDKCFKEAAKLASPVETIGGREIIPPHSTGGALDIEIVDAEGQVIDFGMETKNWFRVEPEFCESRFPGLPQEAKDNREMLISVLEDEGFVNYPREWWHFSFGDQYWAFLKNNAQAIYGSVNPNTL